MRVETSTAGREARCRIADCEISNDTMDATHEWLLGWDEMRLGDTCADILMRWTTGPDSQRLRAAPDESPSMALQMAQFSSSFKAWVPRTSNLTARRRHALSAGLSRAADR